MIIVVSDHPGQVEALCTQFRQKGYLYSVVPDALQAGAAAAKETAGLLLVDTTSTSFDGFELCRTIRANEALRNLPVLLLTGLADLTVLLNVLDCGADAFITIPYDPQSLLSAIEDRLHVQEGKKLSSPVRTRFVVTSGGRKYSVVADRRQLLEFLLSTFELAVRVRHEQEQIQKEMLENPRGQSERLSAIISERDRTITGLKTTLGEKERQESLLSAQSENLARDLEKWGETIKDYEHLLEEKSAGISELEGQVAARAQEKEEAEQNFRRQAEELTAGIELLKSDGRAAATALEREQQARASLEAELAVLREKYANAQKFLDSASRDIGVLNAALAEQKEKQRKVEGQLNAAQKESGNMDRAIQALQNDRAALKNERDGMVTKPSVGDEQSREPAQEPVNPERAPPVPDTAPPFATAGEQGGKEQKPLLPLPKAAQMKLPEPVVPVSLPEAPVPEPAMPATGPQEKEPAGKKDGGGPVADTTGAGPNNDTPSVKIPKDWKVNRNLWFDMIKWVHHSGTISPDQRKELLDSLMKTSRLVQQGRHLTGRQEESMRALLERMEALGYRFH
ncbi:MAG: response regulator [Methanoregula sp.]|nr:response regulator [Methanoregula sp.]